ncbi:MAG: ribosome small subunit-dependent GTPase A, partial [Oscillospiraceae bacterium]
LNAVLPELQLETGEISKKLGRGRHTTRHVELFPLKKNGCVADTPGFSTLDVERLETIYPIDLPYGFREFVPYLFQCKFSSCTHTCEKGCAVLAAVEEGKIHKSRFESYLAMYNDVKDVREWQIQKNV